LLGRVHAARGAIQSLMGEEVIDIACGVCSYLF
jgi:hypothetical protein